MRALMRRMLTAVTVWLTACCALLSSSPHLECLCPTGSRTPFCVSSFLGPMGCCSEAEDADANRCPHCKKAQSRVATAAPLSRNPSRLPAVKKTPCVKTVVQSIAVASEANEDSLRPLSFGSLSLDAANLTFGGPQCASSFFTAFKPATSLPPRDRVVLHQQFVI